MKYQKISYEVLDVDTSSYERRKNKRTNRTNGKRDSEQITKENRKEQLKTKQLADSRNL
jgi:hypothetical protein